MSRLYIRRYNRFLFMCDPGFKSSLNELGIITCDRTYRRKKVLIFEPLTELPVVEVIPETLKPFLKNQRKNLVNTIMQFSSYFKDAQTNMVTPFEAFMIAECAGFDVGRYLTVERSE